MLRALIVPLVYCAFAGLAWAAAFRQPFARALAPALMANTLVAMACGMAVHSLTAGLLAGIVLNAAMLLFGVIRARRHSWALLSSICLADVVLFAALAVAIYGINTGKIFTAWDEFGFWGLALKDSLRLDDLYTVSELPYRHKDYVPAVTVFEYEWLRLAGRYVEADVYRSLQTLMVALVLPTLCAAVPRNGAGEHAKEALSTGRRVWNGVLALAFLLLILEVPCAFYSGDGFSFYHSAYVDYFAAFILAYCAIEAWRRYESFGYQMLVLSISMAMMVLSKMTLIAMLPAVLALLMAATWLSAERGTRARRTLLSFFACALPLGLWSAYRAFADHYVETATDAQSFSGLDTEAIHDVLLGRDSSAIAYAADVRSAYVDALWNRPLVFELSYVWAALIITCAVIVITVVVRRADRARVALMAAWLGLSAVFHALMMYVAYQVSFTEAEALRLASFERYMCAHLVAMVLISFTVMYEVRVWQKLSIVALAIPLGIAAWLVFGVPQLLEGFLPGQSLQEEEASLRADNLAAPLLSDTPDDAAVYVIAPGNSGGDVVRLRYVAFPREITGDIGDTAFVQHVSADELQEAAGGAGYVYLTADAFADRPDILALFSDNAGRAGLYRVVGEGSATCFERLEPQ